MEDPEVHQRDHTVFVFNDRHELHLVQNIPLEVDAGGNFCEVKAVGFQVEDAALGDVGHLLAVLHRHIAAEGHLLHLTEELFAPSLPVDMDGAVLDADLQSIGGEGPAEEDLPGVLGDIDKAAAAGDLGTEAADVDVAVLVALGQSQIGLVQSAAVIEVELIALVQDGVGVGGGAELGSALRDAAHRAALHRQGHPVADPLLRGHGGHVFRRPYAQVHRDVRPQLQGAPAADDLLGAQGQPRRFRIRCPARSGEDGVVPAADGLLVVLRPGHHHIVHIDAGDLDQSGVQAARPDHLLHLDHHHAAAVLHGLGHRGGLQGGDFLLQGHVAALVGTGPPQEGHADGESGIKEVLLPLDGDALHQVLCSDAVDLAAAVLGIDEGPQAHRRDGARLVGGDVPEKMAQGALGEVVALDLIAHGHLPKGGHRGPVAGDEALEQALVGVVLPAAAVLIALGAGVDVGEVSGVARLQEAPLHRLVQCLRDAAGHKAAGGEGIPILEKASRLLRGDDLDLAHAPAPLQGLHQALEPGVDLFKGCGLLVHLDHEAADPLGLELLVVDGVVPLLGVAELHHGHHHGVGSGLADHVQEHGAALLLGVGGHGAAVHLLPHPGQPVEGRLVAVGHVHPDLAGLLGQVVGHDG